MSFILVFIISEPLLLPVSFDTGKGTIYESILERIMTKKKRKAPMGFEPMTSCLLDRRSNHLSYGASVGNGVVEGLIFEMEPAKQLRTEECEADIARQ